MVVAGKVTHEEVKSLSEKWFESIPSGTPPNRKLPAEPKQTTKRTTTVKAKVPADAFYKTFHMPGRFHNNYYAADLLSDVLGRGESSRLHRELVKQKEIFTTISSFGMGSLDPGLLVVSGRLQKDNC